MSVVTGCVTDFVTGILYFQCTSNKMIAQGRLKMKSQAAGDAGRLYDLAESAELLGGLSIWTLRKQCVRNIATTRIGRRIFITSEEIERIRREGLPSLRKDD